METDLFGEPILEKAKREPSKADAEKKGRVSYQRRSRHASHAGCQDCISETPTRVAPATYTRSENDVHTAICYRHKQIRQDNERLGK